MILPQLQERAIADRTVPGRDSKPRPWFRPALAKCADGPSNARVSWPSTPEFGETAPADCGARLAGRLHEDMLNESETKNIAAFSDPELILAEDEMFRWQAGKAQTIVTILEGLNPRERIADIGSFTGRLALEYKRAGVRRIECFDASASALDRARARGFDAHLWRAGEEPCPAAAATFDVIVAADIIEHILNTDGFISELVRIVRRGGYLIVSTPNLAFWLSRIRLLVGKVPWSYPATSGTVWKDPMIDANHIRIHTVSEWSHFFTASGLLLERIEPYSLLPAIEGGFSVRARRFLDALLGRWPGLAFGAIYLLRRPS